VKIDLIVSKGRGDALLQAVLLLVLWGFLGVQLPVRKPTGNKFPLLASRSSVLQKSLGRAYSMQANIYDQQFLQNKLLLHVSKLKV